MQVTGSFVDGTTMLDVIFVCVVLNTLINVVGLLRPFAKIKIEDVRTPFK